jgi:hypothetical protein
MANNQPLQWRSPITNPDSTPTPDFMRWAQQRLQDIAATLTAEQLIQILGGISINAGDGLSGGGSIDQTRTLAVNVGTALEIDGDAVALADTAVTPGTYGDATNVAQITVDQQGRITDIEDVAIAAGGGGGTLLPYGGFSPYVGTAGYGVPSLVFIPAFAQSAAPITGIYFPVVTPGASRLAAPFIYDGGLATAASAPTGTTLVASGSGVALANNTIHALPFSTPFVPSPGHIYYVGVSIYGGSVGTITIGTGNATRNWAASGTFNPPPSIAPSTTPGSSVVTPWWTY